MRDMEIIKTVFGSLLTAGAIVLIVTAFKVFYKYMIQQNKCTAQTKGIVGRYSMMNHGGGDVGVYLPIVFYTVNDKTYRVMGPEYQSIMIKKTPSDTAENSHGYYEENQSLIIEKRTTSRGAAGRTVVYRNPIKEMYPLHSEIDVYYDPEHPRLAYVLRYCDKKWAFRLSFTAGVVMLITAIMILLM